MSKESMKQDVKALYRAADSGLTLPAMLDGICEMLKNHESDLKGTTYSYRLCASDSGYVRAFSLVDGQYIEKTEMDEADVIVTGTEANLLAILQRKLSPMSAILRGKVQIKGSKTALIRFAEFL
ncbi:MAG: SCP2 sterol-binding domain-containing protein [Eubacteriales bacterium]|nr:SCP2 sterol-binding domain-containing protein [Eubacteriales bacterium]